MLQPFVVLVSSSLRSLFVPTRTILSLATALVKNLSSFATTCTSCFRSVTGKHTRTMSAPRYASSRNFLSAPVSENLRICFMIKICETALPQRILLSSVLDFCCIVFEECWYFFSSLVSPVVRLSSMLDLPLRGGPTTTHLMGVAPAIAVYPLSS